jgi:HEAT repeat protein
MLSKLKTSPRRSAKSGRAAVLALMEFRSEKTIPALRDALMDKDFEVRIYAEEALKKIGTPEAVKALDIRKD